MCEIINTQTLEKVDLTRLNYLRLQLGQNSLTFTDSMVQVLKCCQFFCIGRGDRDWTMHLIRSRDFRCIRWCRFFEDCPMVPEEVRKAAVPTLRD